MYGGDFSDADRKELLQLGFTEDDIKFLVNNKSNMLMVNWSLHQQNPQTGMPFTPQELMENIQTDLDESNDSGYTTEADKEDEEEEEDDFNGGKKRRTRKSRRTRITRKSRRTRITRKNKKIKSRKQRGGQCYGRGIGANSYDPNFSIYNTNELQLFPYKPPN